MSDASAPGDGLTVVKLGGSFAFSPELVRILDAIRSACMPVVVVPGGGPFADAVRDAQPRMGFDDSAAHRMALLAMAQFAQGLCGLAPGFLACSGIAEIRSACDEARVAVWSPWPMQDGVEALPASWQLTSDSLALWLANRLEATRLLLLKHREPPAPVEHIGDVSNGWADILAAAQSGVVDPLFPDYARESGVAIWWLGPSQLGELPAILQKCPHDLSSAGARLRFRRDCATARA